MTNARDLDSRLTDASRKLFKTLWNDKGNWSDCPLFDGTPSDKGNLTHLKKLGLVESFVDEGCTFVEFTDLGADLGLFYDDPPQCEGHPAGPYDPMGESGYCDGSCRS